MKENVLGIIMVALILVSAMGATFNVRPALAGVDPSTVGLKEKAALSSSERPNVPNERDSNTDWRGILNGSSGLSHKSSSSDLSGKNKLNLSEPNEWSKSAYREGDKTRLIVGISTKGLASFSQLERIVNKHQAQIVNTVTIHGTPVAVVVELRLTAVTAFTEDIRTFGLASYVEPNMRVQTLLTPNDPYWSRQWGPHKIGANWAWDTTKGSHDIIVAVVDTGIDYTHPDLAANYVSLGYDWANGDNDPKDDFGHGTHCAGIIAAVLINNVGIAGLAQVRIMSEKVLDSGGYGYWDWVANGIIHAVDQGARIISMSLGGTGDSELVHSAVRYAYDAGVLVVAAAGNYGSDMRIYPAAYDEVVAVAATDQDDNTAYFSEWGDWIELAAPGVDVYSTMPIYYVTLNGYGYAMDYEYLSGTSMACPHVAGVAALVWSQYPNKTRDWVRLWLRSTADDLGEQGFDVHYGYGRINALEAVGGALPAHELIAVGWKTPPYIETGSSGMINVTVLNFGENTEENVTVWLLANNTLAASATIGLLASGNISTVSMTWTPMIKGLYNVTAYVVPVTGEGDPENNVLSSSIFVGHPVKAFVLHSSGNVLGEVITNWQALNGEWQQFGDTMIYIDYATLNKEGITYADLAATKADVLIISCAYDPYAGWEFTDSEIEAIERYVHEGHGLVATAGTLYHGVPNNNKLAPLFGLNPTISWRTTGTDLMHLINKTHPICTNVPDPFVFPALITVLPEDGRWDSDELLGGKYVALGHFQESAIVTFRGLVYISPWLETIPPYYHHHLQLLYNALTWSRYEKPEHELVVSIETPDRVNPGKSALINATVFNGGQANESSVELQLLVDSVSVDSVVIPKLDVDCSVTFGHLWTPVTERVYNVTAYAPPLLGEEFTSNNIAAKQVIVLKVNVQTVLVYTDDYYTAPSSRYVMQALDNLGIKCTPCFDDPQAFAEALGSQSWDMVIVDHCNYYSLGRYWSMIDEYVRDGGILALSTFDIDGSDSYSTGLWETLGVSWASNMMYPEPVYRWLPNHPLFNFPNAIRDLTSYSEDYYDDGDHVQATTGTAVAGFTVPPTANTAAIVTSNDYPTVLFSFILNEFRSDQDHDGKLDAVEMWENAIAYLARGREHDVAVTLGAPLYTEPSEPRLLNATAVNRGLSNETNIELQILINGTLVDSILIPELLVGASCKTGYSWVPTVEGFYDVTAYSPPVSNDTLLANNKATKHTTVAEPLIKPLEGQYANYTIFSIDQRTTEEAIGGTWSFTYLRYLSPYEMNVTIHATYADGYAISGWMIVNIFTRQIEKDSGIGWTGMMGYPGWIETSITIGSTVYLLGDLATVTGSRVISACERLVECWEMRLESYGTTYHFWYDKASGLWIGMEATSSTQEPMSLLLTATNIPIGYAYDHDLVVVLESPTILNLGDAATLNTTVYNVGLDDETDVALYLMINGVIVNSTTIPELPANAQCTITRLWLPTKEGTYNITSYSPPVEGETETDDNLVVNTAWVHAETLPELPSDRPAVYVDPSLAMAGVGSTITVSVSIFNLTDTYVSDPDNPGHMVPLGNLYGFDVQFTWDPTMLQYVGHTVTVPEEDHPGGILHSPPVPLQIVNVVNEDGNIPDADPRTRAWFAYASYIGAAPFNNPGESNTVFLMTFRVIAQGTATLEIVSSDLANDIGKPILHSNLNGLVKAAGSGSRDVAVLSIEASPSAVYAGRTVNITAVVANQGSTSETFNVSVYANSTLTGTQTILDLPPAQNLTLSFSWNTTGLDAGLSFTIWAEASSVPDETNADNNRLTDGNVKIKMRGDINGDGIINIYDVILAVASYGSHHGDPEWNPDADIASPFGQIDIFDLVTITSQYGKTP